MPSEIATQLAAAVEHLHASPGLAERVMERSRRRRKRRIATGSLTAAMAIAAAVAIPLATTDHASGVSRLVPVSPPTAPLPSPSAAPSAPVASVDGVDATWIPDGLSFNGSTNTGVSKDNGVPYIVGYLMTGSHRSDDPEIAFIVQRGYAADLNVFARQQNQHSEWLSVRGQRAILQAFQGSEEPTPSGYQLTWVDPARVTVTLSGSGGVTPADLERMAAGLHIHQALIQPEDLASATAAVRLAAQQAFDGDGSTSTILGAIDDGQRLAPVLDELARTSPDLRNLTRVNVASIHFEDASHALVSLQIITDQAGTRQTMEQAVTVELTAAGWKVNQASYCGVLGPIVTACPPR